MKKNKKITEYFLKYGDIPNDYFERFSYLISELNINLKDCRFIFFLKIFSIIF